MRYVSSANYNSSMLCGFVTEYYCICTAVVVSAVISAMAHLLADVKNFFAALLLVLRRDNLQFP